MSRIKYSPDVISRDSAMQGANHETDSDGNPNVFNVEHDKDELWLNGNWYNPDNVWNGNSRWVFVRRYYQSFLSALCGEF